MLYIYLDDKTLLLCCEPYHTILHEDIPNDYCVLSLYIDTFQIDRFLVAVFYPFYNRDNMGTFLNCALKGHKCKVKF